MLVILQRDAKLTYETLIILRRDVNRVYTRFFS